MTQETKPEAKQENGLISLLFNVVIPVIILNKLSNHWTPLYVLFFALSFPLVYGASDFVRRRKLNPLSLLGFLNVGVTGGLAVLGLSGIWFSVKEAFFPFLIGLFVAYSAFGKKPFVETILLNPQLVNLPLIEEKLSERNASSAFHHHLKISTLMLAGSFFVSAVLNFVLAQSVFLDIDPLLDAQTRAVVLNEQIAKMTTWSTVVIMLPSMVILIFIFWYLLRGIRQITGLKTEDFIKS